MSKQRGFKRAVHD